MITCRTNQRVAPATSTLKIKKGRFSTFKSQLSKKTATFGFSEQNEVLVGRTAMIGTVALFGNSLPLDTLSANRQLSLLSGLSGVEIQMVTVILSALILISALSTKEVEYVTVRDDGPLQDPTISIIRPLKFFGITEFGLNESVEIFNGRIAMLAIFASLIVQ